MGRSPWIILALLLVLTLQSTTEAVFLDQHRVDSLAAGDTQTYSLHIGEGHNTSEWNLFFVVEPINETFETPKEIRLYKKRTDGSVDLEVICTELGIDTCLINSGYIQTDDTIYVDVKCPKVCLYDFTAYWSPSFPLTPNKPLVLNFEDSAYAKLFSLDVSKEDYQQLQLILQAQTFLTATSPVRLFANFGKKPPTPSEHQMSGIHLWNDGQGIFIDKADMREQVVTILVEGPAENILQLTPHLRKSTQNEIKIFESRFDQLRPNTERLYFLDLTKVANISENDLNVKISTFTGELDIRFFSDKACTKLIYSNGFHHLGDSQFRLSKLLRQSENVTDAVYIKIMSSAVSATFVISCIIRVENMIRLYGELAELSELQSLSLDNFYVNVVMEANNTKPVRVAFKLWQYTGSVDIKFSVCKGEFNTCSTDYKKFSDNKTLYEKLQASHTASTGNVVLYKLDLNPADFSDTQVDKYKSLTLAVYVVNQFNTSAKYSIQFVDHTKATLLRENHPIKDRIEQASMRYYKVAAFGEGVLIARVHLNEIAGDTHMLGYRTDPREVDDPTTLVPQQPQENTLIFDKNLHQPIYVVVYGDQNAFYAVTLSVERKPVINLDNKNLKDVFNIVVIPEHVQQILNLGAQEGVVVQIHPQEQLYQIVTYSTLPLEYCGSFVLDKYPHEPNCDFRLPNRTIDINNTRKALINIYNPNNKSVRATIKYRHHYQCEEKRTGDVWIREVTLDKGARCVKYLMPRVESFEVLLSLSNMQYGTANVTAIIGDEVIPLRSSYTLFSKRQVEAGCKENKGCQVFIVASQASQTLVHVVAQYVDKEITLIDGLSQPSFGTFGPNMYRYFKYHLEDKRETTVILESKQGYYEFYVNIFNETDLKFGWTDNYPTKDNHHYESVNHYYTLFNSLVLSSTLLEKHNCTHCVALISVCLRGSTDFQQEGHFLIEVSQQVHHLKEHQQAIFYVENGSMAFYSYYSPKANGSLFVSLTTENEHCANIYLAKGEEKRASGSNYLQKSTGNDLYYNSEKGIYSITVEGISNCHYTISVSSSDYRIYELTAGVYKDVELEKEEYAYFFYHHISNSSFKVMSMEVYGEVLISMNESSRLVMEQFEKQKSLEISQFSWHDQKDVLVASMKDKGYCLGCFYLIVVRPLKKTKSSFIISNGAIDVPISTKKEITDKLAKDEHITYRLFDQRRELNISMDVYLGEVQMTIMGNDVNETHTFRAEKSTQQWTFKHKDSYEEVFIAKPIKILVQGVAPLTQYKLSVKSDEMSSRSTKLKMGLPSYLFLSPQTPSCVQGTLEEKEHRLIASTHQANKALLADINVSAKLGDKIVSNFRKDIIENTMLLTFDLSAYTVSQSVNFTFCFSSEKGLDLTVIPVGSVSMVPEKTSHLVEQHQVLTLAPEGKFIVEVFECDGTATVLLSSKFSNIGSEQSEVLNWKRFGQNYLIESDHYGPIFLDVDGKTTLVRWLHANEQKGEGMGYHTYRIPHHKYEFNKKKLVIHVPPIFKNDPKANHFSTTSVKYTVMISDDEASLKRALQCNIGPVFNSSKTVVSKTDDLSATQDFTFTFEEIESIFGNSSYIWSSVVAEAQVLTNTSLVETYKFVYDDEEIPWKESVHIREETIIVENKWNIPIAILSAVLGVLLITCMVRYIIMKIRTRQSNFIDAPEEVEVKDTDRDLDRPNA